MQMTLLENFNPHYDSIVTILHSNYFCYNFYTMKILSFVFMILFSFTVLADSCLALDLGSDCQTVAKDCHEKSHPQGDHEEAHCARTCSPKILRPLVLGLVLINTYSTLSFPQYIENSKSLKPLPLLQPPIA